MIISNPSILVVKPNDLETLRRDFNRLRARVGVADTQDGERDLMVTHRGTSTLIDSYGTDIQEIHRGLLSYEKKIRLNYDPPYDIVEPYSVYYYLFSTTRGSFLVLIGAKSVTRQLRRILENAGHALEPVRFTNQVQDAVRALGGIITYGLAGRNTRERVGGRVMATTRSSKVSIDQSDMERFIESMGTWRDRGLTWIGSGNRPDLTFWIYYGGSILIRHPHVREEDMIGIIDMVIRYLP